MFTELRLRNFKSFKDAVLPLGPFTVIVGENASGKSNVRDALRFLMGMARGHTVAETFGAGFTGGEKTWGGIRGGLHGACHDSDDQFAVGVSLELGGQISHASYDVQVVLDNQCRVREIAREGLTSTDAGPWFDASVRIKPFGSPDLPLEVTARVSSPPDGEAKLIFPARDFDAILLGWASLLPPQAAERSPLQELATEVTQALRGLRCLDVDPNAAREPDEPGHRELGERGEHLPAVLQSIVEDENLARALPSWVAGLAPTECQELRFPIDPNGKVNLQLVESGGRVVNAPSASDGTIRLLAYLAAMFGPRQGKTFIIEEIENGIHPTRLHLLANLIERSVKDGQTQVIVTTHSPLVLQFLSEKSLADVVIAYRGEGQDHSRLVPLRAIPDALDLCKEQGAMRLFESGWFEDTIYLSEPAEEPAA